MHGKENKITVAFVTDDVLMFRFLFVEDRVIQISVEPFQKKNTDPRHIPLNPKKHLITLNNFFIIKFLFKDLPNITRLNGLFDKPTGNDDGFNYYRVNLS